MVCLSYGMAQLAPYRVPLIYSTAGTIWRVPLIYSTAGTIWCVPLIYNTAASLSGLNKYAAALLRNISEI